VPPLDVIEVGDLPGNISFQSVHILLGCIESSW
jgi:hypothetical protein